MCNRTFRTLGCSERPDQQPNLINGWFWSGSGVKLGPTNNRQNGDWSHTGGQFGYAQPDNREIAQVKPEQPIFSGCNTNRNYEQ